MACKINKNNIFYYSHSAHVAGRGMRRRINHDAKIRLARGAQQLPDVSAFSDFSQKIAPPNNAIGTMARRIYDRTTPGASESCDE